jgi:ABC-type sugar transport system ATPase subunit
MRRSAAGCGGEILRLHAAIGFTLVYVTHSREEAQEIGMRTIELG